MRIADAQLVSIKLMIPFDSIVWILNVATHNLEKQWLKVSSLSKYLPSLAYPLQQLNKMENHLTSCIKTSGFAW